MARILLAAFGTAGSTQSSLALALGLRARGHQVKVAASRSLQTAVSQHAIGFSPIRPDRSVATSNPDVAKQAVRPRNSSTISVKNLLQHVQDTYADLLAAGRGVDLLISHPAAFCAPLVAEKLTLPWLSIALAPATLFSSTDPPVLPYMPWLRRLPRVAGFPHSLIFRAFKAFTRKWMEPLDRLRASEGLGPSPNHPFFEGMFSPYGTLGLFSRTFAVPQKDWPAKTTITGYPFSPEIHDKALPEGLEHFLSAGPAPVVFTLGSTVVNAAGSFYRESLSATKVLGCRAVLLTGDDARNRTSETAGETFFSCPSAPYLRLFPRAAAVVHQGGIGTTSHAMQAGVPMLVVPHIHDQPDNAHRAERLGVARVQSREGYTGSSAAAHLKLLLTETRYAARSQKIQAQMKAENGVASACDVVEEVLRRG